jgi:hypothetical protein
MLSGKCKQPQGVVALSCGRAGYSRWFDGGVMVTNDHLRKGVVEPVVCWRVGRDG